MHPAFSVIFLTTLIGAGQGLFLALFVQQMAAWMELSINISHTDFHLQGSVLALGLLAAGLLASFFHLGHPERAWRSATSWRTSWLSREVIALPLFMLLLTGYIAIWFFRPGATAESVLDWAFWIGSVAAAACLCLFICTGMIYACLRFLQEWATPLTVINFILLGSASGFMLATALSGYSAPMVTLFLGILASIVTSGALLTRGLSLLRNRRLAKKSTLQSAIGTRHREIRQLSQGAMGGSFNTREFFHGKGSGLLLTVKTLFLLMVFPIPLALLWLGLSNESTSLLGTAAITQYLGLLMERWYFFAETSHPQNLYYQAT